jgi:hypothetical protein
MVAAAVMVAALAVSGEAQQRGRGGFGFGGQTASLVTIASNEAVQKDLGLSSDVASKLTALRDDYRAAVQKEYQDAGINFQNFQNQSNEERQRNAQKMAEINRKLTDEFNPKVKALLSADQLKRLAQIQLQANLRNLGPAALTTAATPEVAAALSLTNEQKEKLNAVRDEFAAKQRELFTGGNVDRQAMDKLRAERKTKAREILTAEQQQKLDELKGSEFDVAQINLFGFGGRRGKN